MKKTTILPILGLALVAAVFLTAFSVKRTAPQTDPEATFEAFLAQFPPQQLPYSIAEKSLRTQLEQYTADFNNPISTAAHTARRLDWKFYRFLPNLDAESSFSRLPMQAEPIALFALRDNYAVLYSTSRSYGYGFCTYNIAVLDKKGVQISCNPVAKVMPETLVSADISTALQAEIKTWRIEWKKDYQKNGLEGNKIKNLVHEESETIDLMKPTAPGERRIRRKEFPPQIYLESNDAKTK